MLKLEWFLRSAMDKFMVHGKKERKKEKEKNKNNNNNNNKKKKRSKNNKSPNVFWET
jgi:hypothetical protein